jgi:thiamine biosynthesis lipoprotein
MPLRVPGKFALVWPGGGWRGIVLDPERRHITLPRGVGLDLGGIAKGMAVDAALEHLQTLGIDTALVNAGGDLAVRGLPPGGEAESWPIRVPLRDGIWTIALRHGALATSGVARRRWRQGDEERHHLLDPRSGLSTHNGVWSVSVAANRCVQAEVAAKVACILGPAEGAAFLTAQGLSGVLVQESGEWHTAGSWPASPDV